MLPIRFLCLFTLFVSSYLPALCRQRFYDLTFRHAVRLGWAPASLYDPWGSQVLLGMEYGLWEKTGVVLDIGIPLLSSQNGLIDNSNLSYKRDFKARLELKQYIVRHVDRRLFFGAEFFYRWQRYDVTDDSYSFNYRDHYYDLVDFSRASVDKQLYGGGLLFGGNFLLAKNVLFEFHIGIGIKGADVTYSDVQNPELRPGQKQFFDLTLGYARDFGRSGFVESIHFPFGIKLVYLLRDGTPKKDHT